MGTAVRSQLWRHGVPEQTDFPLAELSDHLADPDALFWVDICEPDHQKLLQLAQELDFDRHAVEDAISFAERPKVTRHPHHLFLVTYATMLDTENLEGEEDHDSRLRLTKVSAFMLPRGLVTVRSNPRFGMDEVTERWEENADLLKRGPAALLYGLLDVIVDGHFDTVQQLDDAIESLEDGLFDVGAKQRVETQQRTFRARKELVELRRVVLPMREVVASILRYREERGRDGELSGYFNDLYDHVLRAAEWTESLRDMVSTIFETTLSLQDARLNTIMKKLTAWAAIIAVPTAITGWFGQNVPYPGFNQGWGVWLSTVSIALIAGALYVSFRRRDWL